MQNPENKAVENLPPSSEQSSTPETLQKEVDQAALALPAGAQESLKLPSPDDAGRNSEVLEQARKELVERHIKKQLGEKRGDGTYSNGWMKNLWEVLGDILEGSGDEKWNNVKKVSDEIMEKAKLTQEQKKTGLPMLPKNRNRRLLMLLLRADFLFARRDFKDK